MSRFVLIVVAAAAEHSLIRGRMPAAKAPALGPRLDAIVAGAHGGLAGIGGAAAPTRRVRTVRVLERALDERDRHLRDDIINDGLGFGAFRIDDEVAARNEFGQKVDVHRGGTSGVLGVEVGAALLRELPDQRTVIRDGVSRRRRDLRTGVEGPALVPRVRRAPQAPDPPDGRRWR